MILAALVAMAAAAAGTQIAGFIDIKVDQLINGTAAAPSSIEVAAGPVGDDSEGLPPDTSAGLPDDGGPTPLAGPCGPPGVCGPVDIGPEPAAGSGAPPGDAAERLVEITDIIDKGDDDGIREGELDDIQAMLEDLTTAELDWVFANMTDQQLERLFGNVHSSGWFSNDWNDRERREFYDNLARIGMHGNLETWMRIGEFSPKIDPDPTEGLPDSARENETRQEYYDSLTYGPITGPVTDGDPHYHDPRQGAVGDCYLIAGLILLAEEDPGIIEGLIDENDNGTFTITFGDGHQEVVNPTIVVDAEGNPAFARGADGSAWAPLIEKAYAQRYGGWGSDPGITGGQVSTAIERLTGRDGSYIKSDDVEFADLVERFDNGDNLSISTIDQPDDMERDEWLDHEDTPDTFSMGANRWERLHQNHAFIIIDVDEGAETVSVLNPWDPSQPPLELGFEDLQDSINGIYVNEAP